MDDKALQQVRDREAVQFCGAVQRIMQMLSAVAIAGLLLACCPAAVFGAVGAVIVDPVERVQAGWTFPHIAEKRIETVAPTLTHTNPTPAVVVEVSGERILAARDGMCPRAVFDGFCCAVRGRTSSQPFDVKATARLTIARSQVSGRNADGCSAITSTGPEDSALSSVNAATFAFQYRQSDEFMADKVERSHGLILHDSGGISCPFK